jgi:hypothetical protein
MLIRSLSSLISRVTVPLPPDQARMGAFSEPSRSTSCMRPERMGPTRSAPWLWNTIAKRDTLSLMISSKTMSAWFMPYCGWLS